MVSSLAESLPEPVAELLLSHGIAVLRGLESALTAVAAAAAIGSAHRYPITAIAGPARPPAGLPVGLPVGLDEWRAKRALAACGLPVPTGRLVGVGDLDAAVAAAAGLGYPVVARRWAPGWSTSPTRVR